MNPYEDLVVDTNVLVHSANPMNRNFTAAVTFLQELEAGTTKLCFELGAATSEPANRSRILSEYWQRIPVNSTAAAVLATLLQRGQWHCVSDQVPNGVRRRINQYVHDATDRIFARVAHNSIEHVLVTHDQAAFPAASCEALSRHCNVEVVTAAALVA